MEIFFSGSALWKKISREAESRFVFWFSFAAESHWIPAFSLSNAVMDGLFPL